VSEVYGMKVARLGAAFSRVAILTAACGGATPTSAPKTTMDVHGVLDLNDSHGGVWGTQDSVTAGAPCSVTKDLLPGAPFPRAFSPDAQVIVKDETGATLGAASLDTPKSGTVRVAQGATGAYYCEFTWRITVPASAQVYAFEFPGANPQRFDAKSVPSSVVLSIGDGAGFVPRGY
jgi:hypothetical protein